MSDSYKGNRHIKKAGVKHDFTPEQLEEFVKCAEDPHYFIENFVKIINLDGGLVPFKPFDYQTKVIDTIVDNRFSILKWPRQYGKALSIDTPILTKDGFKKLDDLKVGDQIFGPDGNTTTIRFITDTMFDKKTYKVKFDNGDELIACAEHLWTVNSINWKIRQNKTRVAGPDKVLTTEELIPLLNHSRLPYISFTKPIQLSEKEVPIDPYTLGVWLGDGYSDSGSICVHPNDSYVIKELKIKSIRQYQENLQIFLVDGLFTKLRETGLLNNKHIPEIYFTTSFDQRLELIKGLMDTDGTCSKNGYPSFSNKNELLIDQFRFLLSSIGIKSHKRKKIIKDVVYYEVSFCPDVIVFKLDRKASRQKVPEHKKNNRLYISSIEEVNSVPVKCLQVDNEDHLFLAGNTLIPTHNTTTIGSVILWYILFNEHYTVAILAHKHEMSRQILSNIQTMFENLPKWLQQGVSEWNKGSVVFENGSQIITAATTPSAVRGLPINWIYLDEFAFVPPNMQEEFYTSAYPTITSGKTTKMTISSTPKGLNKFWRFWKDAVDRKNDFVPNEVHWSMYPGRDDAWKEETIRQTSPEQFRQEFEVEFLGSSFTLIHATKLQVLEGIDPLTFNDNLKVFKKAKHNHLYAICVDTAAGAGLDYSAFVVVDVTTLPYEVVASYRNNQISPYVYPTVIHLVAKQYSNAIVLIENQVGSQVADVLHYDLEYENVLFTAIGSGKGQHLSSGYGGGKLKKGIQTTSSVKKLGCNNLKTMVENDRLIINDEDILDELRRFVANDSGSFEAEDGHDDLVMTLVLFGWMTDQEYFRQLTDVNLKGDIANKHKRMVEEQVLAFILVDDGTPDLDEEDMRLGDLITWY